MKENPFPKKAAAQKTIYEQRFDKLMMMMRIDKKLKSATLTHHLIDVKKQSGKPDKTSDL